MAKKIIDWEAIGRDYRAGVKSLRVLEAEHGVSNVGIHKHAKAQGWVRDLAAKVRSKAEEKVSKSVVSAEVSAANQMAEKDVVEANAELISGIILAHRTDIQRSRRLAMRLLDELEQQTDGRSLIDQLRYLVLDQEGKSAKERDALLKKVLSLGSRTMTMKTLSDSLRGLIALEREAFGINGQPTEEDVGIESIIKRVTEKQGGAA